MPVVYAIALCLMTVYNVSHAIPSTAPFPPGLRSAGQIGPVKDSFSMIPMSRVQRRLIITLFVVSSLNSAAMIASFVLTPIISYSLSGRVQLIGLPNALSMVGRAGAGYPLGWLLDKAGRRIGLAVGLSFVIFGMLVSASAISSGSLVFFLGGAVLLGVGRAALEQTRYAAAEIFPLAQQAKVIGLIVFAGTVGAVGGPLLVEPAVGLARQQGFHEHVGPFWIGAALMGLALILLLVALRPDPKELAALLARNEKTAKEAANSEDGSPGAQAGSQEAPRGLRGVIHLLKLPDVQLAIAAMAIGQMVMTLLMVVTPLHMNRADYKADAISYVLMAHTLGMFGLSGLSGWLASRVGRVPMIFAGALVQVLAAIMMPLSTELPVLFVSLFLLGLGWNFSYIAGSSLLSAALEGSRQRGRVQGINEAMVAIASAFGSLGTGSIYSVSGVVAVAVSGVFFSAALGALALWLGRQHLFALAAERG